MNQLFRTLELVGDWDRIWDSECCRLVLEGHGGHLDQVVSGYRSADLSQTKDMQLHSVAIWLKTYRLKALSNNLLS